VVFDDADLDTAVEWSARAIFTNSGQVCLAGSRIYVHEDVMDEFLARLVTAARELTIGDPTDPETDVGALASKEHFAKVSSYFDIIAEEGGTIHTGRIGEGWVVEPTVVSGVPQLGRVCREEIFGPVAAVASFASEQEVVGLANDTRYGLNAILFTENLSRMHRVSAALRAGTVWGNCFFVRDLRAPFGGVGDSGVGREGGFFSREFFTEPKAVVVAIGRDPK
ncbi:MAG: aldehyde dehydrogenase family protein, partial [Pseudonocardiaceae bacterium]|nr:aldehyde dehydrogenase family protein [Pseudonocardiaceae bacterium]